MDDKTRRVNRGDELRGRGEEQARDYAPTPGPGDGPDLDPESNRRARQIQSEIAHTRAEMSETIEALQDRLRPANLVAGATDRVKTATSEKVRSMADTASGTAQEVARETRARAHDLVEGARQNPIPALMIGAGVAWLLMDRSRAKDGYARRTEWSEYSPTEDGGYGTSAYGRTAAEPVYSDIDERGRRLGRNESLTSRSRETIDGARDTARRGVRRTQTQLQRMLAQNPLLVGAAAVLAGAAVGASLPETERENELMGEARDSVVDRAQETAREAATTVREVAGEAAAKVADKVTSADGQA